MLTHLGAAAFFSLPPLPFRRIRFRLNTTLLGDDPSLRSELGEHIEPWAASASARFESKYAEAIAAYDSDYDTFTPMTLLAVPVGGHRRLLEHPDIIQLIAFRRCIPFVVHPSPAFASDVSQGLEIGALRSTVRWLRRLVGTDLFPHPVNGSPVKAERVKRLTKKAERTLGEVVGDWFFHRRVKNAGETLDAPIKVLGDPPPLLFLSHSSDDKPVVEPVARELTRRNAQVFIDDPGIRGGEDWLDSLAVALFQSDFLVFFMSPNFAESKWCRREFAVFRELKKKIIGVLLNDDFRAGWVYRTYGKRTQWVSLPKRGMNATCEEIIEWRDRCIARAEAADEGEKKRKRRR